MISHINNYSEMDNNQNMMITFLGIIVLFHSIWTHFGNSESMEGEPCAIPFLHNGIAHHDCVHEGNDNRWCYVDKQFQKRAFCKPQPKEFEGCHLAKPNISLAEVEEILNEHNAFRAKMPALRMRKIAWNSELAQLAQVAANKCEHNHVNYDLCGKRLSIGQNLYYNYNEEEYPETMPWKFVIKQWSQEKEFYDMKTLKCQESKICGHFTQVAWDSSYLVGCAKAHCHGNMMGKTLYSILYYCSYYHVGNIGERPPYTESNEKKCSDCYLFSKHKKFRCTKDHLCEACDSKEEGCIGTDDIEGLIKNNKLCADIDSNCHLNKQICKVVKAGNKMPPLLEYVRKCQKTCEICT